MGNKIRIYINYAVLLILAILFLAKFGKPALLRTYIDLGIGTCEKIPILCLTPEKETIRPQVNREYLSQLTRYELSGIEIYAPKTFKVINEKVNKVYYKRYPRKHTGSVMYLLNKKPNFFVELFPKIIKEGIKNDLEFLNRTMAARTRDINNLTDTFFVIMKSIFTPNLGDENNLKIIPFALGDKNGFITYNLAQTENYFDCDMIDSRGEYFKVYIKDKAAELDLEKVMTIISTVKKLAETS